MPSSHGSRPQTAHQASASPTARSHSSQATIHWAIVGGESGPHARPMEEAWALEIRNQCKKDGVAFFFKQWGGIRPKSGGRTLRGKEWNEYPPAEKRLAASAA
ncbi:DUF5131 family protein [Acidocella facilis]|uniref:DUF5131 family protein n=1 Tax=Acidocella facilis TaxID=525 RepID=UPI002E18F8A1